MEVDGVQRAFGSALIVGLLCLIVSRGYQAPCVGGGSNGCRCCLRGCCFRVRNARGASGFILIWILVLGSWLLSLVTEGAAPESYCTCVTSPDGRAACVGEDAIEIVGKATKATEDQVISILSRIYP